MRKDGVLVLHGIFRTHRSMARFARFLERSGFAVLNLGYPSTKHSIEALADNIHPQISAFAARVTNLHFVGYSMGGLLKRGGRVYTKIIPDASSATLIPIIERKVIPDSIVYSDCWRAHNVLDVSEFKHYRINHSKLFADKKNHINGIENFWNQAKRHMRKFNGIPRQNFGLFLKEC